MIVFVFVHDTMKPKSAWFERYLQGEGVVTKRTCFSRTSNVCVVVLPEARRA